MTSSASFCMALLAGGLVVCLSLFRMIRRKSLLSPEYPQEGVCLALLTGAFFALSFITVTQALFPNESKLSTFPWAVLSSMFAAPIVLLTFYWKHLQAVTDRLALASSCICDDSPTKRATGYLQLEKIATENLSLAPTVIELLAQNIRYTSSDRVDLKYQIDILSRIWQFHARSWWDHPIKLEPDLRNIDLNGMELWSVHLKGFFLEKANLSKCYLRKANLDKTILWNATLKGADLTGASFLGARLQGANLLDTMGLTQRQLDDAEGNLETLIPSNLSRPSKWRFWCEEHKHDCFMAKDCSKKQCQTQ